jgi:membrane associated rhomboid family serine protease
MRSRAWPSFRPLPLVTLVLTVITGLVAGAAFLHPALQAALRRDPAALAAGAWWRLVTPLLVRTDGWATLGAVLAGTLAAGSVVEYRLGGPRTLALYLAAGLVGQAAGYAWDPTGAGSSVAALGLFAGVWSLQVRVPDTPLRTAGVVGGAGLAVVAALVVAALAPGAIPAAGAAALTGALAFNLLPRVAGRHADRVIGTAALAGGVALTALRDNHGPAILAGALAFAVVTRRRWRRGRECPQVAPAP